MEAVVLELKGLQRLYGLLERGLWVGEYVVAEGLPDQVHVGGLPQLGDDGRRILVRHLVGGQEWDLRLLGQRRSTSILRVAAARSGRADTVRIIQEVGVWRDVFLVAQ